MNGPEHYREAERLGEAAAQSGSVALATVAHMHAVLAIAAALAIPPEKRFDDEVDAWRVAVTT